MFEDPTEEWKDIPNYDQYMISSHGRVFNKNTERYMKPDKHGGIELRNREGSKGWSVQVLMGCVFLGNDINDPCRNRVLFRDKDSSNRNLDNLYIEDTSDLPGEIWKPLKYAVERELKDYYMVSNLGRIKSIKHYIEMYDYCTLIKKPVPELIISIYPDKHKKYCFAYLACKDGSDVNAQVHRLVAAAFCKNDDPKHKTVVNHIDGDPSNNKASNLEWCTQSENTQHAIRTGLRGDWKGRKLRYGVLNVETNIFYNSLSDLDRALGWGNGYCSSKLEIGKPILDKNGNGVKIKVFKDLENKVCTDGQHCIIDEFPGREFISLGEASLALGRWEGYISDALCRGGTIRNKAGQLMHVHLIGSAPTVSANVARITKKAAGLISPKKERIKSDYAPRKPIKHIETGQIYTSMAAASRAMGKDVGYISECFAYQRDCIDANGIKWTFEFIDPASVKAPSREYKGKSCYIDEIPNRVFRSMHEANEAIGRSDGYIADRVYQNKPVLNMSNEIMHVHFIDG